MNPSTTARRSRWLIALGAAAGLVLVAVVTSLPDPPDDDIEALTERVYWLIGTLAVLAVPLVVGAAMLWQIGQRAVEAGRFPPPGTAVAGQRAPVVGPAAVRRGRWLQALALLVGIGTVLIPAVVFFILQRALGAA